MHKLVQFTDSFGTGSVVFWIDDPAFPEDVVDQNHTALPEKPESLLIISPITALVCIDEYQVEGAFVFRRFQ